MFYFFINISNLEQATVSFRMASAFQVPFFLIAIFPAIIFAFFDNCCFHERILFAQIRDCAVPGMEESTKSHYILLGKYHIRSINVCGDGKPPDGHYCGVGQCNIIGCECDHGCLPGNPLDSFQKVYADCIYKPDIVYE